MKKFVSIILCVLLVLGSVAVGTFSAAAANPTLEQAIEIYEKESGNTLNTKRYYFLMPNGSNGIKGEEGYEKSWYNDNADRAGVYWWDTGIFEPDSWPGYEISRGDSDSVFYADLPDFAEVLIFNNFFDGGADPSAVDYSDARQTVNLYTAAYEPEESDTYPDGLRSKENMIFVIDPDKHSYGDFSAKLCGEGEWYYYYGSGCYGTVENGNESNCIRDDHDHENLYINFDPSNTGWTDYEEIYCVVRSTTYAPYYPQGGSVPTRCTDYDGDGIYTYDLNKSKINLKDRYLYYVSFENDNNQSTEVIPLQTINLKDTVYATGETHEHYKTAYVKWTNNPDVDIPSLKEVVSEHEENNNVKLETYRNYFLIPDGSENFVDQYGETLPNWFNEYSTEICINYLSYNCENFPVPYPNYVGFTIEQSNDYNDNIYYADIPVNIKEYLIDNGVISSHVPTYTRCESYNISHDSDSNYHDDMIYVFDDMDRVSATTTAMCSGTWYYYYGSGCYGTVENGNESNCIRDDHDHFALADNKIYFDTSGVKWENITKIYCHIYDEDGNYFYSWQTNSEKAIDSNHDGVWTYNLSKASIELQEDKTYYVIFSDGIRGQTRPLELTTADLSHTAYITGEYEENDMEQYFPYLDWKETTAAADHELGDVDGDGRVSVLDASLIQRSIAQIVTLTPEQTELADTDKDGKVSVLDAAKIQRFVAQIITKL